VRVSRVKGPQSAVALVVSRAVVSRAVVPVVVPVVVLLLSAGCSPADRELRVGHAVPVGDLGRAMNRVSEGFFDSSAVPRLRIAPWTVVRTNDLGSETGQAERFASDPGVVAVVGHSGSKNTVLAAPIYASAGVPVLVPTATSRLLQDARDDLFLLSPPDDVEGAFLADHAVDSMAGRRVAMLYVADAFGIGIHEGVRDRMAARGATLAGEAAVAGRECTQGESGAMRGITRSLLARSRPDVVIVALSSVQTACALREMLAIDPAVRVLAADAFDPTEINVRQLSDLERAALRYVVLWEPSDDARTQEYVRRVRAETGRDPTPAHALTHDAFMLVAQAIAEGNTSRAAVRDWLHSLGTPAHPPVLGVTGPIAFTGPRGTLLRVRRLPSSHGSP